MLTKWEFWTGVMGLGALSFFTGLTGKWAAQDGDYSDEMTWAIWVGAGLMVIGVMGIVYSYFASRYEKSPTPVGIRVKSEGQSGGTTAGVINIGTKDDEEDAQKGRS